MTVRTSIMTSKRSHVLLLAVLTVLALTSWLPLSSAFTSSPTVRSTAAASSLLQKKPTSTTLFYRDDVPPIGSSPTWEIPNSFDQFVTQRSMQSFMYLLASLRDDYTIHWLHEFTHPVMQSGSSDNATLVAAAVAVPVAAKKVEDGPPKIKVSLAQAAQSALDSTDRVMQAAVTTPSKNSKANGKTKKKKAKTALAATATATDMPFSKTKTAPKKKSKKHKPHEFQKPDPTTASAVSKKHKKKLNKKPTSSESSDSNANSNTGITALYSGIGVARKGFTNVPKFQKPRTFQPKFAPIGSVPKGYSATTSSDTSALYGAPKGASGSSNATTVAAAAATTESPKKSFAPFAGKPKAADPSKSAEPTGSVPKSYAASTSSGTSALYSAPKPRAAGSNSTMDSAVAHAQRTKRAGALLKYHGLAIFNRTRFPTWESFFEQLLDQPKQSWIIQQSSANQQHRKPDITYDVDPSSICRRMLSVRTQIAQEFVHDLDVLARMGGTYIYVCVFCVFILVVGSNRLYSLHRFTRSSSHRTYLG